VKVSEQFVIAESPQTLWEFFEQFDQVARCVPGVEEVTVVDDDNSRVRLTQSLGPMTATFDLRMRVTARDPGRSMEFTAVGRSVRGAAGNVRASHAVRLSEEREGSTRVLLEGDLALGGMLGSVGQKVVAKQAAVVTQTFAQALQERLNGAHEPEAEPEGATEGRSGAGARPEPAGEPEPLPLPLSGTAGRSKVVRLVMGAAIVVALLLAVRRLRSR